MTVLLVPRRAGDARRDRLWEFCRARWETEGPWPIVEGHHDDGPFNRSIAINAAARDAGDWDVAVIIDSDVALEVGQVKEAVDRAKQTGRLTLAYTRYIALNEAMTSRVLTGFDGDWTPGAKLKMTSHVSSCIAVPRALWDRVGGFDERFEGWGWEDLAFATACRVLAGGVERVNGDVFHLWHPDSPERAKTNPMLKAGQLLANRYCRAVEPTAMAQLVKEARNPDGALVIVITDGRRDCIERCIPSAEKHLKGLITRRVISDDSANHDYQAWLRLRFPDWEIVASHKRSGFGGAVDRAWTFALESGQRWVFHLEDDFTFNRDVDLTAMAAVLDAYPNLAQMALRRQAWFPKELEAGGVVEMNPEGYTDRTGTDWAKPLMERSTFPFLSHREFFTTNPCLLSRRFIAAHPWPTSPHSESRFTRELFRNSLIESAYWGSRDDEPWVHHDGERSGKGY